ncbi:hypothetical protein M758_11G167700 [Ceratodon purpureus]|nr:hypothetical protein M758_11G167700 [Ceratodon purpureus]
MSGVRCGALFLPVYVLNVWPWPSAHSSIPTGSVEGQLLECHTTSLKPVQKSDCMHIPATCY